MSEAAGLMDRVYRRQRHIYDATRKYYLLGRDGMIGGLSPPPGGSVLEIGCGTGRNLIEIARRYPSVACYGVDISRMMLATARARVAKAGPTARIDLAEGDAASFDPGACFGRATFDRVAICYALSMIPQWHVVLDHALDLVAEGGALHIVDFGDQAGLPRSFATLLDGWLSCFHVTRRETLVDDTVRLAQSRGWQVLSRSLFRGYATWLTVQTGAVQTSR